MTFLNPALALAGVACVAIPIIIHLLMHRRRKPVLWGAMRFLLEAYRRQKRRLQMEKWLLLATRCALVVLIGLALGKPLLGAFAGPGGGRTVFLLIDTGLASGLRGSDGKTALDRHKLAAREVLASLRSAGAGAGGGSGSEGDRAALITLGGPGAGVVLPPSGNLAAVGDLIDALTPTDARTDLAGGLSLAAGSIAGRTGDAAGTTPLDPSTVFVAVFSDFREGSVEIGAGVGGEPAQGDRAGAGSGALGGLGGRLPEGVRLALSEPATEPERNISVVGVEPLRSVMIGRAGRGGAGGAGLPPQEPDVVRVQLRRSGAAIAEAGASTVRAELVFAVAQGQGGGSASSEARSVVRWTPGMETATTVLTLDAGGQPSRGGGVGGLGGGNSGNPGKPGGRVSATIVVSIDEDALQADNRARRGVELRESLRIGVLASARFGRAERLDALDAAAWLRLALAPASEDAGLGGTGTGDMEITDIEPAALDQSRLAGLDAAIVPRPDLLSEASWARLRQFMDGGGLVLVMPPAGATVHLWPDAMTRGMNLTGVSIPREALVLDGSRRLVSTPGSGGNAKAGESLLGVVAGELDELLRPVSVLRALPITVESGSAEGSGGGGLGGTLLSLDDGAGVLWAGGVASPASGGAITRGLLVYFGIAPELSWSDLPARPLMVPLLQEIVRQGVGRARGSVAGVAGSRPAVPPRTVELREVREPGTSGTTGTGESGVLSVEESAGRTTEPVRHAGVWRALDLAGADRGLVIVNPDARAGRVGVQDRQAIAALASAAVGGVGGGEGSGASPASPERAISWLPAPGSADITRSIAGVMGSWLGRTQAGAPIARALLAAALAFAILELWLARRASHAELPALTRGRNPAAPANTRASESAGEGIAA